MIIPRFQRIYIPSQNLTDDESMIAAKHKSKLKYYMPQKPIKWGFKLHCLSESNTGYCYKLRIRSWSNFERKI